MRSFTLSLVSFVLLIFVAGCSQNNKQILQPQKNASTVEKSAPVIDSVYYSFNGMVGGENYSSWGNLTFWQPDGTSPNSVYGDNTNWMARYPVVIRFPLPDIYNQLSIVFYTSIDSITFTTTFSDGTEHQTRLYRGIDYDDSDPHHSVFTYTAPYGKYLSSLELSTYKEDGYNVYSLVLRTVDNQCPAPELSNLKASPSELWPANNKETEVTFTGSVENICGSTTYKLTDEYGVYSYTGTIDSGNFSIPLELMASRKGNDADGRTYTFTVTSENAAGKVVQSVDVIVPHDQGKK